MALYAENISGKIVGIGDIVILPNEKKQIPIAFEGNPTLKVYENCGLLKITGRRDSVQKTKEELADEEKTAADAEAEAAEELRKKRLASLKGISEEDLAKLANELGISPAECKDQTDVLKKVRAALRK